jgi:hypothetical protein
MLDEQNDVGSIRESDPYKPSSVHLIKNKVHDINPEISILIRGRSTKVGMIEQVNQEGPNGIIVTSTWSNRVHEQAL